MTVRELMIEEIPRAQPLRILIAGNHELFRESLAIALRLKPEIAEVAEIGLLGEVAKRIDEFRPDVLLLDLQMERPALAEIPTFAARTRIVIVTSMEQPDHLIEAVRAGARGVVMKASAIDTLMAAIRAVANGEAWLNPALQARLIGALAGESTDRLTTREREIVRLVALGLRNAEVGEKLFISAVTVKTHLARVFEKLGIRDRADLVLYAVRAGLIGVGEERP